MPQPDILKDVNFLESSDLFLELKSDLHEELMEVLKVDIELFKALNIMDYSLLVCVNESYMLSNAGTTFFETFIEQQSNRFRRIESGKRVISISIIDIL